MSYSYAQTLLKISIAWSLLFSTPYGVPFTEPDSAHPVALPTERLPAQEQDHEMPFPPPAPADEQAEAPKFSHAPPPSPYCQISDEGAFIVRPELVEKQTLQAEIKQWAEKTDALHTKLSALVDDLLVTPAAQQKVAGLLEETQQPISETKKELVEILEKLPASHMDSAKKMLILYFQAASQRAELQAYQDPFGVGLNSLRFDYAVEISSEVEKTLFATGGMSIPGTDLDPVFYNGHLKYRLALSAENTFHALVRTAARSPKVGGPRASYMQTVRCLLGRSILGKYAINKTILVGGDFGQPIPADQNFCLSAKTSDFYEMVKRDTEYSREMTLRMIFLKEIPQVFTGLAKETWDFWKTNGIVNHVARIAGFPDTLVAINANRQQRGLAPIPMNGGLSNAFGNLNRVINDEYKKNPAWEDLRLVWTRPAIQSRITSIFNGCGVSFPKVDQKAADYTQIWPRMMRSDDAHFMIQLYSDVGNIPGRWLEMDKAQLTSVLHDYVIAKKVETSMRAFSYLLDYSVSEKSADADEMMEAIYDDLSDAFTHEFNEIWEKNPEFNKWLSRIVNRIEAERGNAGNYQKLLTAFTEELVKGAESVSKILDPKRPPSTLPYVEKHVIGALDSTIYSLSKDNMRRYRLMKDEKDPKNRQVIWQQIDAALEREAKAVGASCKDKPGFGERLSTMVGSWVGNKTSVKQKAAGTDCEIMSTIAAVIGADRGVTPPDLSMTLLALNERVSKDKVNDFVVAYRDRLGSSLMAENRLLDLPLAGGEEKLWQKMMRVKDINELGADVKAGLKFSVANLEGYLKTVVNARSENDLMFFIKRTNVINAVLGQNVMDNEGLINNRLNPVISGEKVSSVLSNSDIGFVFPTLVELNRKLQDNVLREEDFTREVWSEFVDSQLTLAIGVLVGWAAKGALGTLPRFSRAPVAASVIERGGARTSSLISGHADVVTLLLIANMGRLYVDKRDFDAELGKIKVLRLSEGVAMMSGNPFALINEDDYYKQKVLFENASNAAVDEMWSTAKWLILPLALGHGIKQFSAVMFRGRGAIERNFDNIGHIGQRLYERSLRAGIRLRKNLLSVDLKRLGNPEIEIAQLQAGRDAALAVAKTPRQRFLINESYNEIIKRFGSDIEKFAGMPRLRQAYANALYGQGGSGRSLETIYLEYIRITQGVL